MPSIDPTLAFPTLSEQELKDRAERLAQPCDTCGVQGTRHEVGVSARRCCRCHVRAGGEVDSMHPGCLHEAKEVEMEELLMQWLGHTATSPAHLEALICNIPDEGQKQLIRERVGRHLSWIEVPEKENVNVVTTGRVVGSQSRRADC
jgi:hypothetical protein